MRAADWQAAPSSLITQSEKEISDGRILRHTQCQKSAGPLQSDAEFQSPGASQVTAGADHGLHRGP